LAPSFGGLEVELAEGHLLPGYGIGFRRCCAEHPFASLKYRIFGHPRFLLRGRRGAQTEISLAVLSYNLKRMLHVLGRRC
jgi:hypothetical protein